MTAQELREKFLKYFESKGHKIIPSASLIPENDPTVLFTTAGMHPLVPYLMGEKHPEGKRLCNLQRCVRTGDIDEVGDESHLTFFEMMGYWSLGDYWKKEAIEYIFEFLTQELGLNAKNFAVSCFEGDEKNNIPRDTESFEIWRSLGIPEERIAYLGYEDNWWGPAGVTGPCGPDSELFVWVGEGESPAKFDPENKGWMELCNDVFMQYNKTTEGKFEPLAQKNVDFGMGFERLLVYLNHESDIYKTELFWPIIEKVSVASGKSYGDNQKEFRRITDHLRASNQIILDGIRPGKNDASSVLRTLLRVSFVELKYLCESKEDKSAAKGLELIEYLVSRMFADYSAQLKEIISEFDETVRTIVIEEYQQYRNLEKHGIGYIKKYFDLPIISGEIIFTGRDTFGLDYRGVFELWKSIGKNVENDWEKNYHKAFERHRELSRTASAGMFKGGLADAGEETKKLHTAAHLMLEALRRVLGDHVLQRGSNITAERLRFDFSHNEKMTPEQILEVEKIVNEQIEKDLPVTVEEMTVEEAEKKGAMGVFKNRYGEKVKVYTIGDTSIGEVYSKEICGGPHVERTGELGHFRIKKEESSSAGVRRIKAVL